MGENVSNGDETRLPPASSLPTAQQVAAAVAALTLAGPMAMGGMPVLPVTVEDEKRRQQEQIQQASESTVGVYQSSAEAEAGLARSQVRLAGATLEVEGGEPHDVSSQDVIAAANRVFAGDASPKAERRFRSAFTQVAWDTTDLYILRDREGEER